MSEAKHVPFEAGKGTIPVYPGEPREEKLRGAPLSEMASKHLNPEEPVEIAYPAVMAMREAGNRARRENVAREVSRVFARDPTKLTEVFRYWEEIALAEKDKSSAVHDLMNLVPKQLTWAINKSERGRRITTGELKKLLESASSGLYRDPVETMLSCYLAKAKDVKEAVDLVYEMAKIALESDNDEMIKYITGLFCYETKIYQSEGGMEKAFYRGLFSLDDEVLRKALEVDLFVDTLGLAYNPEAIKRRDEIRKKSSAFSMDWLEEESEGLSPKDQTKMEKIISFYSQVGGRGDLVGLSEEQAKEYPYNLILQRGGEVRSLLYQKYFYLLGSKEDMVVQPVSLPGKETQVYGVPEGMERFKYFRDFVSDVLKKGDGGTLAGHEVTTAVEFLRPDINEDKISELLRINLELKKDLKIDFVRALSSRGNLVKMTDEALRSFGYNTILLEKTRSAEIKVTLKVGNYFINLVIDEEKNLVDPENKAVLSKKPIDSSFLSAKWIETMVLAHLHELVCTEPKEFVSEGGTKEGKERASYVARVGHLRRVPNFTMKQVYLAMEEQGWNLIEINEQRKANGEGPKTYVREIINDSEKDAPPIATSAVTAMEKLKGVVKKAK